MNLSGFGTTASQLPYRQTMHGSFRTVQETVTKYIEDNIASNNAIFTVAIRVLNGVGDGQERIRQAMYGVTNYADYLMNVSGVDGQTALRQAVEVCINGFIANIVLRSPHANELDQSVRGQLQQAENNLGQAINLVNQHIAPAILKERSGGFSTGQMAGLQPRRQEAGFSNNISGGGGINLTAGGSANNVGSFGGGALFSESSAPTPSQGGGMVIGVAEGAMAMSAENLGAFQTDNSVQKPNAAQAVQQPKTKLKSNMVTYMNYEDHKTFGLLKKVLPSDVNRQLMPELTLENNFAAMASVDAYTKIRDGELQRKDLMLSPGAGYALETIFLSYGQREVSSLVNETAGEILHLDRKELERLTFSGALVQVIPECIDEEVVDRILRTYSTGMITHGRLTSMMGELEAVLKPETMLVISNKLTELATDYWRFVMGQGDGGLENYFLDHDSVTEYLRRTPGKERLSQLWSEFPAVVIGDMFLKIPLGNDGVEHTLGFRTNYIRIPYFAAELPIGVNADPSKGFGIVSRNVTPGLYNLCKTVHEVNQDALYNVIMTNEGRMVNVVRSKVDERDCFYIYELKNLL